MVKYREFISCSCRLSILYVYIEGYVYFFVYLGLNEEMSKERSNINTDQSTNEDLTANPSYIPMEFTLSHKENKTYANL